MNRLIKSIFVHKYPGYIGHHEEAVHFSLLLGLVYDVIIRLKIELMIECRVLFLQVRNADCDSSDTHGSDPSEALHSH